MIYLLFGAKPFVEVRFSGRVGPERVPVVPVSSDETVKFKHELYKLRVAFKHLVEDGCPVARVV
jgi:hypothetical protein